MTNLQRRPQAGFTIIELMIATAILSTILILVTVMMINIGSLYYKGINQARVQDNVRSIVDELSQHLQLSSSNGVLIGANNFGGTTVSSICFDSVRYSYVLHKQIGSGPSKIAHVLWRDSIPSGGLCTPANLTNPSLSGGSELIAPNSRLSDLTISPGSSPYSISVGVAYGDDDLLTGPGTTSPLCKGDSGDQYCATAKLNTIVAKRIN